MELVCHNLRCPSAPANEYHSTVISAFGIIILSIIGSLFARNHHMVMGLEEDDPEDNKAVAASVFIAVAVYGVRTLDHIEQVQAD